MSDCDHEYFSLGVVTFFALFTTQREKREFNSLEASLLSGLFSLVIYRKFFRDHIVDKVKEKLSPYLDGKFVDSMILFLIGVLINGIITRSLKWKNVILTATILYIYFHSFEGFIHEKFTGDDDIIDQMFQNSILVSVDGVSPHVIVLNIITTYLVKLLF